jgi:hypothetical protein
MITPHRVDHREDGGGRRRAWFHPISLPSAFPGALVAAALARVDCDLRLGVRRTDGRCEAHAWVEAYGVSLSDSEDPRQRFAAFDVALIPAPNVRSRRLLAQVTLLHSVDSRHSRLDARGTRRQPIREA